jgi:hypothetical protein
VSQDRADLVSAARRLLERPDETTAGIWPRATALLARQSLEAALDELWRARAPGVEKCSARAQLLCLPYYLRDEPMAERVSYTWAGISRACHQHPYELPPTSGELVAWIETVERFAAEVKGLQARHVDKI